MRLTTDSRVLAATLCKVLTKVGTCQITFGERIWFQADGKMWSYRVIDGQYCNYRRVIPNYPDSPTFATDADTLIMALDAVSRIAKTDAGRVRLTVSDHILEVSATGADGEYSSRSMNVGMTGSLQAYVHGPFLRSLLLPHSGTAVQIRVPDNLRPLAILPSDSSVDSVSLLMPMKAG